MKTIAIAFAWSIKICPSTFVLSVFDVKFDLTTFDVATPDLTTFDPLKSDLVTSDLITIEKWYLF